MQGIYGVGAAVIFLGAGTDGELEGDTIGVLVGLNTS